MTYLYIYNCTHDTGFAPCVENGSLTLACCKPRMRNSIGKGRRFKDGDEVYFAARYHKKFLFLAKLTEKVKMTEYFSDKGKKRTDGIYDYISGKGLVRNSKLKKGCKKAVHDNPEEIEKDLRGEYVLISKEYIYLGKDAVEVESLKIAAEKVRDFTILCGSDAEKIIEDCKQKDDKKEHKPNTSIKTV